MILKIYNGVDSFIEVISAFVVLWNLSGELFGPELSESEKSRRVEKECIAVRCVGVLLLMLSCTALARSIYSLATAPRPDSATLGIVISIISLSYWPMLVVH